MIFRPAIAIGACAIVAGYFELILTGNFTNAWYVQDCIEEYVADTCAQL